MYVDSEVIESAAMLIQGAINNGLPVKEEVEWKGLDEEQAAALEAVLDALGWDDLCEALRTAAVRLPEPEYDNETADAAP